VVRRGNLPEGNDVMPKKPSCGDVRWRSRWGTWWSEVKWGRGV
jgi:hypothetical protein